MVERREGENKEEDRKFLAFVTNLELYKVLFMEAEEETIDLEEDGIPFGPEEFSSLADFLESRASTGGSGTITASELEEGGWV